MDGDSWTPASVSWTHGADVCGFECDTHYTYNSVSGLCKADTQSVSCGDAPTNATWLRGTFIQTWDGDDWAPVSKTPTYTANGSIECSYQCANGATRNGSKCVVNGECSWEYHGDCEHGSSEGGEWIEDDDEIRYEWTCAGSN